MIASSINRGAGTAFTGTAGSGTTEQEPRIRTRRSTTFIVVPLPPFPNRRSRTRSPRERSPRSAVSDANSQNSAMNQVLIKVTI